MSEVNEISKDDKQRFLYAVGTGRPFEKQYSIFNDTILFKFRGLKAKDADFCEIYAVEQMQSFGALNVPSNVYRENYNRHYAHASLACQLMEFKSSADLKWGIPNLGTGKPADILKDIFDILESGVLIDALIEKLNEFNQLESDLLAGVNETENFWVTI